MTELTQKKTMTSLELVDQINIFREVERMKEEELETSLKDTKPNRLFNNVHHSQLLKVIRDEFEEEIGQEKVNSSYYNNSQGKKQPMFKLTLSQARQVLLRESKQVRKAVLKYIESLEQQLLTKTDNMLGMSRRELINLALDKEEEAEQLVDENIILKPKAIAYDEVVDHSTLYTMSEAAGLILKGKNELYGLLQDDNSFLKDARNDEGKLIKGYTPQRHLIKRGLMAVKYSYDIKGYITYVRTFITVKGLDWIRIQYTEDNFSDTNNLF